MVERRQFQKTMLWNSTFRTTSDSVSNSDDCNGMHWSSLYSCMFRKPKVTSIGRNVYQETRHLNQLNLAVSTKTATHAFKAYLTCDADVEKMAAETHNVSRRRRKRQGTGRNTGRWLIGTVTNSRVVISYVRVSACVGTEAGFKLAFT